LLLTVPKRRAFIIPLKTIGGQGQSGGKQVKEKGSAKGFMVIFTRKNE